MMQSLNILDFDKTALRELITGELALERFRADQISRWVYRHRIWDFSAMTDIRQDVRVKLAENLGVSLPEVSQMLLSKDGSRKFVFRLPDNALIESVHIKQPSRYTLCISSQVGCAIGCRFCMTGTMGLKRHLKTSEIIGQVMAVQNAVSPEAPDEAFSNIVFMGMGEPLHNFDNVARAVRILNDPLGLNFSSRKITVSTSGMVPAIQRLGEEKVPANLAVSLNATTDEVRTRLIPINRRWPLEALLLALKQFPLRGRARITIEYVLLAGVNDLDEDLARLPKLIRGIPAKVNLIPYNNNTGLGFQSPSRERVAMWHSELLARRICTTVRWSKGEDIKAACGQLVSQQT